MSRQPQTARNPPLTCQDCDSQVVKRSDEQFVCVGCDRTYRVSQAKQRAEATDVLFADGSDGDRS